MKTANHLVCAFLRRCIRQMQRLGLDKTQLAKRLKVSRPYVTKLLSGDVNISFGAAARLAHALEMDFFPDLRPIGSKSASQGSEDQAELTGDSPRG